MKTYISILRGINVSGKRMIKMGDLQKLYESLGFKNIHTYIQSGNVVFQFKKSKTAELEKKISKLINDKYNFEVPVLVLETDELRLILENNPFVNTRNEDSTKLHVTFLEDAPDKAAIAKISGNLSPDEYLINGKAIYLFCPNGYGNTKLNNNFFESKLKLTATTRNWKTSNELLKIAESI